MKKYKLKDLQGCGLKEDVIFDSLEEIKRNLYDFHIQDCELLPYKKETLEGLCELGSWEIYEIEEK